MPKAEGGAASTKVAPKPAPTPPQQEVLATDDWFVAVEDVEDKINVVYYGREGSAKTTDACRMANLDHPGKVLVINAEGGLKTAALKKRGVDTSKIVQWPNPNSHERVTHKGLQRVINRVKADLAKDPDSWLGVLADSATELHIAYLDAVQQKRVTAIKNSGKDIDEDFVDIADYGTMSKLFRETMRSLRDLPCHTVITALERRDVDKDTGKPQYGPAVSPGIQTDLLGYVDFVIMCKAADEDGPFRGLTRANSRYRAKDRFDVLPRVMVEPTFDRIMAYLTGVLTEDTDPFQDDLNPAAAPDAPKQKVEEETAQEADESATQDPQ